jgi:hypothetical protein
MSFNKFIIEIYSIINLTVLILYPKCYSSVLNYKTFWLPRNLEMSKRLIICDERSRTFIYIILVKA